MIKRKTNTKMPSAGDREVGLRIAATRHQRKMSQTELANGLGLTFKQVQKYEKGVNRVGAGRLAAIAEKLAVPISALLSNERMSVEATLGERMVAQRRGCRMAEAFLALDPTKQMRLVELAETMSGTASC